MPYTVITDFAGGLDTRKSALTAPSGTLQKLVNAAISPGGEIVKRRAFVQVATLTGTFGLAATENTLYCFTRNTAPPTIASGVPGVGLTVQQIPNSNADLDQADYDTFDGKVYLVCTRPSGTTDAAKNPHYYDAVLTEGAGKGYYIRAYQSKIYAVTGKYLYFTAVDDPTIWNTDPVVTVTSLSNANPAVVTVAAADIGKFTNGMQVIIKGVTATGMTDANGTRTITGVGSPANTFKLQGVDTSAGAAPQTTGITATPLTAKRVGAGFINLSLQDADSEFLTSLEVYYDQLSIFSSEATQLWSVDADPLQNTYNQLLRGCGTIAPRSTQQYGSGDVLILASSGIRSLKARDASNAAAVSDIGSPVDGLIQSLAQTRGSNYMSKAIALLEPVVGRFWLVFPDQIFVLSYFPGPKITAWSQYTVPFTIDQAVTCGGRIFLRSGTALYCFGGADGNTYDNCGVEVRLPYLSSEKPGHRKIFEAVDVTCTGTWRIAVSYDFANPDNEETVSTATAPSWNSGRHEMAGFGSHYSMRFYNNDALPAVLSNLAVHFKMAEDED